MLKLHNYSLSSASFRVRIGLELKGLKYEYVSVGLKLRDGEQQGDAYRALNPQGIVPLLVDGEVKIGQSAAILEYLEEKYPQPSLFPPDAAGRARVRSLALFVACEIQPLNNLRVQRQLEEQFSANADAVKEWRRHWARAGFNALEKQLDGAGRFCHGDQPTLADCFLVPQVFNLLRPNIALDPAQWPAIHRIFQACLEHPAFDRAQPKNQPDAP